MPNPIRYSTTGDTLSLKKGNYYIGTGDVGKGPTSSTDYWNGITPPTGGYTIYAKQSGTVPRIYTASTDASLVLLTNTLFSQNFTTATQCFNWYSTQNDYFCVNIDYESIITSGLTLCLDAGFAPSYPLSGITWFDISYGGNNGTLTNGPLFDSSNGGIILFDGVNDFINWTNNPISALTTSITCDVWVKFSGASSQNAFIISCSNFKLYHQNNSFWYISGTGFGDRNVGWTYTTNWVNFVYSFDGTNPICYINGTSYTVNSGGGLSSQSNLQISGRSSGTTPLLGNIAIVKFYNRALSASEILQNYNAQKNRYPNFDSDAQAFISAAGITNTTQKNAINQLVVDLKSYSLWTKFSAIYPFVGGTATSHKYNLKDPRDLDAAYRIQFNGGWTHDSNGIQGDGSTGYADTFAAMNTAAIPNRLNHWSSYNRVLPGSIKYNGILDTGSFLGFGGAWGVGQNWFASLQNFTNSNIASQTGFVNGTVTSSSASALYRNGTSIWAPNNPSSMTNQFNYYLGATNQNGSPGFYNTTNMAFASLGGAMNATDAANLYTAVQAFQTTLGRQV